ncbi:NAD(P)-dependent oxidoreductase [Kiloniella sp. EL199]|uniref:NAD(P)-dependent oxidoreductase n=1 Tax=Kiloniella sp. EL199 TaxID=2107581 RepID=UPI000EA097B4|nr:NAD(P)-dependent oxidoreductase [Kiloniella sp. EL199]
MVVSSEFSSLSGLKVGVVGLGKMGWHFAKRLHTAGMEVFIHSRTRDKASELEAQGLIYCQTPAELAQKVDSGFIIICVTDTFAVEQVICGEHGLLSAIHPDTFVIDMGTTQVMNTRDLAGKIQEAGAKYLDAPVSGGAIGAEQGTLSIMIGGAEDDFHRSMPLFNILGENINHVGPLGAGQIAKTANQMIVGMTIDAVAEALTLASRAGADPAKVRNALLGGFADSRILQLHGQRMIERSFEPGARATVQLKDVKQAVELAEHHDLHLTGLETALTLWQAMIDKGLGNLDQAGFIRTVEKSD